MKNISECQQILSVVDMAGFTLLELEVGKTIEHLTKEGLIGQQWGFLSYAGIVERCRYRDLNSKQLEELIIKQYEHEALRK